MKLTKAENLSERIYGELRAGLQRGVSGAEIRYIDVDIAERYGTSRMPVREALLRLVNEGYLEGTTRGFRVPVLSDADIRDVFEVRRLLEPEAAANAARDLRPADADRLTAALDAAREAAGADGSETLMLANIAFRAAWLGAVRNTRLSRTIARFADHVQTVRAGTLTDEATRARVLAGLQGLHTAFLARDPAAARARMAGFVAEAERSFFSIREAEDAPSRRAAAR